VLLHAAVALAGGDVAAIFAPYISERGNQLHTGLRVGFAVPVLENAHATSEGRTIPVGLGFTEPSVC
jgi:hypothetical protein